MDAHYPPTGKDYGDEPDKLNEHWDDPGDPDGVVAEEQQLKWQHSRPTVIPEPPKKRHWPVVLVIIVLLAAATAGAYWLGSYKASAPAKKTSTAQASQQQSAQAAAAPTKHYDSVTHTLSLDYPGNWVVSDTADKLTVTSPALKVASLNGAATGHIIVTIQNQQTSIPGYPSAGGIANLDSDKLTYKQPSSVQRAQTYLSYVAYQSPNGVDTLFLTGDNGYQSGQQVPMSDVVKGNPLVSVTFATCTSDNCVNGPVKPITLLASSWNKAAFKPQVVELLQSLTFN